MQPTPTGDRIRPRVAATLLALAGAAWLAPAGCTQAGQTAASGGEPGAGAPASPEPGEAKPMTNDDEPAREESGQVDEHAGERVEKPALEAPEGTDEAPLPEGALLRFQRVYMGEGTAGNYRFVIYGDGRVFAQDNGGGDSDPPVLFTAPYPTEPTKVLDEAGIERLRGVIRESGFSSLAPGYAAGHKVFGGDLEILDVRAGGETQRVIMDRTRHPAFTAVRDAALALVFGD